MRVSFLSLALFSLALSACVAAGSGADVISADGQDQICGARLAEEASLPLSAVRVNARDVAPSGNAMVFVQVVGGGPSSACEIDGTGRIVDFNRLR